MVAKTHVYFISAPHVRTALAVSPLRSAVELGDSCGLVLCPFRHLVVSPVSTTIRRVACLKSDGRFSRLGLEMDKTVFESKLVGWAGHYRD